MDRKAPPLTVICVLGPPSVTSRERKALVGMGLGDGDGHGEELAVPHSALASGAMTNRTEAEARAARMTMAGFNRRFRGPREFTRKL